MATVNLKPASLDVQGVRAGDRNTFAMMLTSEGAPLDLTGYAVTAQVRKAPTDTGPPGLAAVIDVVDAAAGQLIVSFRGDDVATLLDGCQSWTGFWDLQLDDHVSDPWTIVAGRWSAESDVTREVESA